MHLWNILKHPLEINGWCFQHKQPQLCFFWCTYELTLTVTDIIIHHFYVWLFLKTLGMRWWEWWLDDDEPLIYNFTSPKDSEHYSRLPWLPWWANPFISVCFSLPFSLCLSGSVSRSTYRSLQWRKTHWETAWRRQPAWEPFQAPLSEGDRGLTVCQLGTSLESCTSLCCTLLAVDPILMPAPSVNLHTQPCPFRNHIHVHRHSYHIHNMHSILTHVLNVHGRMVLIENMTGVWKGRGQHCRRLDLQHHQCRCLHKLISNARSSTKIRPAASSRLFWG